MKQKETISEGKAMNRARRWMAEHGRELLRDLPVFAAEAALVILAAYLFSRTPWMAAMAPASDCISVSCTRWPNMFRRPCALQRSVCSAMGEDGVMG